MPRRYKASSTKRRLIAYESDNQRQIRDWLTYAGIPHARTDAALTLGPDGKPRQQVDTDWPDLSGTLPPSGRSLYIETKATDGVVSDGQAVCHATLRLAGAVVIVATSAEEVAAALSAVESPRSPKLSRALDAVLRPKAGLRASTVEAIEEVLEAGREQVERGR